jgi:hypothetical protein
MKRTLAVTFCVAVLALSGCASAPKDNVKACEIQRDLINLALAETGQLTDLNDTFIAMSQESESMADSELALHLAYQIDFFKAVADPTTQQGWTPSQEMNTARTRVAEICRSLGVMLE